MTRSSTANSAIAASHVKWQLLVQAVVLHSARVRDARVEGQAAPHAASCGGGALLRCEVRQRCNQLVALGRSTGSFDQHLIAWRRSQSTHSIRTHVGIHPITPAVAVCPIGREGGLIGLKIR